MERNKNKKNMKSALIVSGGNSERSVIERYSDRDFIIAVDSGTKKLTESDLKPDIIIGDLDSLGYELSKKYSDSGIEIIKANCEKDETDTELAVIYAIEQGFKDIVLLGATGSRLDHTIGNIILLKKIYSAGLRAKIVDGKNEIMYTESKIEIKNDKRYKYISVLPTGGKVQGLSLRGFKYDTDSLDLEVDSVIGISNELISEVGHIEVKSGSILVIRSID